MGDELDEKGTGGPVYLFGFGDLFTDYWNLETLDKCYCPDGWIPVVDTNLTMV